MEQIIRSTIENLNKRGFISEYAENAESAKNRVLELVKGASSVGLGGSVTLYKTGIQNALAEAGYKVYGAAYAASIGEDSEEATKQSIFADVFLSSSNAVTEDGTLINIDGKGNRVAGLIFGPEKIIMVIGKNKIAANEAEAIARIKAIACPMNGKRLKKQLPCVLTGKCADCRSADRMCRVTVKHEAPTRGKEFHIILVNEDLGY